MRFPNDSNVVRTLLYSSILALIFFETVFIVITLLSGLFGASFWSFIAGMIGLIFAFVQFIWMSVLLGFNNKPTSKHRLCTIKSHFISIAVFTVEWLTVAILLSISAPLNCEADPEASETPPQWFCPIGILGSVFGWILFLVFTATMLLLYAKARRWGSSTNVAHTSLTSNPLNDGDNYLDL